MIRNLGNANANGNANGNGNVDSKKAIKYYNYNSRMMRNGPFHITIIDP
jgi:hypothetical protein